MTFSMSIVTFLNAWWIMLFFVLPFHIRTSESCTELEYAAAPKAIRWKRVLVVDTLLALAVTLFLALLFNSGVFHVDTMV